jgi:hypothetical protein
LVHAGNGKLALSNRPKLKDLKAAAPRCEVLTISKTI